MEFLNVYIKNELFKLPVAHRRLKHLMEKKFKLSGEDMDQCIDDFYAIRAIESNVFHPQKYRTNIFLLNYFVSLLKKEHTIVFPSDSIPSSNDDLVRLINEQLGSHFSKEELFMILNQKHKQRSNGDKDRGYSVQTLRKRQRELGQF